MLRKLILIVFIVVVASCTPSERLLWGEILEKSQKIQNLEAENERKNLRHQLLEEQKRGLEITKKSLAEVKQAIEEERERLKEEVRLTKDDLVELHLQKAESACRMHAENIRIKEEFEEYMVKSQVDLKKVQREFQDYITQSQIGISELKKGLVVSFVKRVFFDSGKAEIRPQAYPILEKVAQVIREHPHHPILIRGHTDNVPIGSKLKAKYATNWELSTARAVAILRHLLVKYRLPPEQLIAAGYSKYQPLSDNDTPQGRQRNRRIEIVILPERLFLQPETSSPEEEVKIE